MPEKNPIKNIRVLGKGDQLKGLNGKYMEKMPLRFCYCEENRRVPEKRCPKRTMTFYYVLDVLLNRFSLWEQRFVEVVSLKVIFFKFPLLRAAICRGFSRSLFPVRELPPRHERAMSCAADGRQSNKTCNPGPRNARKRVTRSP